MEGPLPFHKSCLDKDEPCEQNPGVNSESKGLTVGGLTINDLPTEILEHILRNLNFEEKKLVRLVCKLWNAEVCRQMTKDNQIYIPINCNNQRNALHRDFHSTAHSLLEFVRLHRSAQVRNLPTLLHQIHLLLNDDKKNSVMTQLSNNPQLFPALKKITLPGDLLFFDPGFRKICKEIIRACAASVTHLEFQESSIAFCSSVMRQKKDLVFPELHYFGASFPKWLDRGCPSVVRRDCAKLLLTLQALLQRSPKLRALKVERDMGDLPVMLDLSRIQHLICDDFWHMGTPLLLDQLTQPHNCPAMLTSLVLTKINFPIDILQTVVIQAAPTLKNLILKYFSQDVLLAQDFPLFPQLEFLSVATAKFARNTAKVFRDDWDSWIRQTPKLKELHVSVLALQGILTFNHKDLPVCSKLEKIAFYMISARIATYEGNQVAMVMLRRIFPNLRRWEILSEASKCSPVGPDYYHIQIQGLQTLLYSEMNLRLPQHCRLLMEELMVNSHVIRVDFTRKDAVVLRGIKRLIVKGSTDPELRMMLMSHPRLPDVRELKMISEDLQTESWPAEIKFFVGKLERF